MSKDYACPIYDNDKNTDTSLHRYTIPVEWEYIPEHTNTTQRKTVTKLRCICGKEKERP